MTRSHVPLTRADGEQVFVGTWVAGCHLGTPATQASHVGGRVLLPSVGKTQTSRSKALSPAHWQEVRGGSATGPRSSGSHLVARRQSPSFSSLLALAGGPEGSEAQSEAVKMLLVSALWPHIVGSLSKLPGAYTRARDVYQLERTRNYCV